MIALIVSKIIINNYWDELLTYQGQLHLQSACLLSAQRRCTIYCTVCHSMYINSVHCSTSRCAV